MMNPYLIAAAVLIASPLAAQDVAPPASCDYGTVSPDAPEETAQFAFLIGDFQIHLHGWKGDDWTSPLPGVTARWNGRYGLGGMAIVDEWYNPDPAQDASNGSGQGINVRLYDPEAEEWDMMWVATGGYQVQDLRAKMIDGKLTMWQVYPEREDFRAEFNVIDTDHWNRIAFARNDEGEWVKKHKLAATRIACTE